MVHIFPRWYCRNTLKGIVHCCDLLKHFCLQHSEVIFYTFHICLVDMA